MIHPFSTDQIFSIQNDSQFNDLALKIFTYQAENNPVYQKYLSYLKVNIANVKYYQQIPFLPVEFFKTQKVITGQFEEKKFFESSGTTGKERSRHYVNDLALYKKSLLQCFENFYGSIDKYCILALLPNYMENENSSLIYMVDTLMQESANPCNGYFLNNTEELAFKLKSLDKSGTKILLIGVSYALIDFVEMYPMQLSNTIIMETGGMKGRRKELTKNELHTFLSKNLGVEKIHSEYGMTELLSQAYSYGEGKYLPPPWVKILIRDSYDPFCFNETGKSGGINIIDLANVYSCSFIETKDLGKVYSDGSFEVLGRFDYSDIRGCNLLVAE